MNNNYNKYFTETENGLDIEANNIDVSCITSRNNKFSMDNDGNLICNSVKTNEQSGNLNFDSIYPIGSIYMSVNASNPSTLFEGTTWEKIIDRFLVGAGNKYSLGSTGGVETHNHTSAAHSHGAANTANGSMYAAMSVQGTNGLRYKTKTGVNFTPNERKADGGAGYTYTTAQTEGVQINGATSSTTPGNTGNQTNIPPYLAINIWKRVS